MKTRLALGILCAASSLALADTFTWPTPTKEMKPWAYNWWMASAVDEAGLEYQCSEMEAKGFGGFHVIPIYGANGPDKCYRKLWRDLLSPQWVEAWNMAARKARSHNLDIDLTMGSGWCFGGPWIPAELGASSGQKVKRAGPGAQGLMIDPFNPAAMRLHIAQFDPIFGKDGKAERPRAFYHDSYEYYGAAPRDKKADIDEAQLATFKVWTDWCRENGYITRNEAHGAPSNWLDFYSLADIPETEMFGKKDRDILISKFASSASHVKGTTLVSAESCTWIDEHFNEKPGEIKLFIDRLFLSGVNHVFYHGLCYSPVEATWPGWCFYASLEMNPRNPIWREVGALNAYITRCQSLFQTWQCDNDLLIIWDPDTFRKKSGNHLKQMSVHAIDWFYGEKIGAVAKDLYEQGYAFDYISPRQLKDKKIDKTRYAAIIDPEKTHLAPAEAKKMPFNIKDNGLMATRWKKDGKTMYFVVNQTSQAKEITSPEIFTLASPLSGNAFETKRGVILPNHSLFLIGDNFSVKDITEKPQPLESKILASAWHLETIAGGPEENAETDLTAKEDGSLDGWETWLEYFSGTIKYSCTFDYSTSIGDAKDLFRNLDLGDVREIARVRLNGIDLGVRFMPPYKFGIPGDILKDTGNKLEIEITNLGANRIRYNDINGIEWKYFTDINMVDINYKKFDASTWPVLQSGLLGPVKISTCKRQ